MRSEKLFEEFCDKGNISWRRLLPDNVRTPDYEITLGGGSVYVEVKELTLTPDEAEIVREWEREQGTEKFVTWGDTIGRRIRREIESGRQQIKRFSAQKCPGVLLLYDGRPPPINGIWPYEILSAMYGCESIDLHVPEQQEEPVRFGTHRFGKGKKLRRDSHTYISAIAIMSGKNADGHIHIDLFNNVHAQYSLPFAEVVRRKDMTAYTLAFGKGNEHRGWIKIIDREE